LLVKAWSYATKGDHPKAIATLQEGMTKVPALVPYAHALLGIEYIRIGRTAEALTDLTEAASLFPHDAAVHSNLALALCMSGQRDPAEREARVALYLEPNLFSAVEIIRFIDEDKARPARQN
jgi:Flp pilus assembly protein TadD